MGEAKRRGTFLERYVQSKAKEQLRRKTEQCMLDEYADNLASEGKHTGNNIDVGVSQSFKYRKRGNLLPVDY